MSRTIASQRWKTAVIFAFLPLLVLGVAYSTFSAPEPVDLAGYPWLYLRDGAQPAAGPETVEVLLVGDVMLGRGVLQETDSFHRVSPWLGQADLVMGNLEGVLAAPEVLALPQQAYNPGEPIPLLMPYRAADDLAAAGFDLLGLANNHALDLGEEGLRGTVAGLAAVGIEGVGAGPAQNRAWTPTYCRVRGLELAFLAINAVPVPGEPPASWGPARWDPGLAAAAVAGAAARSDAVVVSIHWGYEHQTTADPAQRAIAETLLAAGADLVVGHHPHAVQGTQVTPQGGFVAYSLGNFVFDQWEGAARQGLALRALFDGAGLRAVQALPVRAGPRPELLAPEEASALLARLEPETWRVGYRRAAGAWRPVDPPGTALSGRFVLGAIDLTGDGAPERVSLEGERVAIGPAGAPAWESPPDWAVLDLALGDPNDDGRYEILLAMNKPGADGAVRSHPFIVGYRGGGYRTVWGGSAVGDPLLEVELYDVDGDRAQELVVLEALGEEGVTAVSVWDWHGWGFSRAWRSPAGRYRDLQVHGGAEPVLSVRVVR